MSLRIHVVRATAEYLRGATALAAASGEADPSALLGVAAKASRRLEAEKAPWTSALAALLRAGVKAREGERGTAVTSLLEEAARLASASGMAGYACAAQRALALVRGGPDAREKIAALEATLADRGVKDPARFAAMLVPGFESLT
jgi:hypothetical protein